MEPDNIEDYNYELQWFFHQYSWLFNFQMTNLLAHHVLDDMPREWQDFGNSASIDILHYIAKGEVQDGWPPGLAIFVRACSRLRDWQRKPCPPPAEEPLPPPLTRGVSAKKRHELSRMVPAVRRLCVRADCHLVLDVGAGVGHLGECLRHSCQLRVLGLEQSAPLVEAAGRRRHQLCQAGTPSCPACLHVARCRVADSADGQRQLRQLAAAFSSERCSCDATCSRERQPARWCLTGLHSCGDLAPQLLRLLLRLPEARALLLLSCCYHKADQVRPLSRRLAAAQLTPFGRRLACQQSVAAWCRQTAADHSRHAAATGWRALLQVVAARTGRTVRERRRHGTHRYHCFAEYAAAMLEPLTANGSKGGPAVPQGNRAGDPPVSENEWTCDSALFENDGTGDTAVCESGRTGDLAKSENKTNGSAVYEKERTGDSDVSKNLRTAGDPASAAAAEELQKEAVAVTAEFAPRLLCVEFLAALQACAQPVLEGALLLDRLYYLREHSLTARLVPLFDDELSPRAWALLAWKR